jgi:putative tRNA adenosine deaminase-associated protein
MGPQRAPAKDADALDGFGVAVVREDGKWRCSAMRPAALTSLAAAETELRELRSAGAVFGLLDVDDEFFVIVRPAPAGTRLLLSDATAALDYDIAAEVLEKLDADIEPDDLDDADPFEEGDLGLLSDVGLPDAVLGVIISEYDLYADEQLGRIAREMGFAEELAAVLDRDPRSRSVLVHLNMLERALKTKGMKAFEDLPAELLRKAMAQLDTLVMDWSARGLTLLRARASGTLARTRITASTRQMSDFGDTTHVQVREASVTTFMEVDQEWERANR